MFEIGKTEALAVANLHQHIDPNITAILCDAVAKRGMARFLLNDVVARGVFNTAFTSAAGVTESWISALTNGPDQQLVPCWCHYFSCPCKILWRLHLHEVARTQLVPIYWDAVSILAVHHVVRWLPGQIVYSAYVLGLGLCRRQVEKSPDLQGRCDAAHIMWYVHSLHESVPVTLSGVRVSDFQKQAGRSIHGWFTRSWTTIGGWEFGLSWRCGKHWQLQAGGMMVFLFQL